MADESLSCAHIEAEGQLSPPLSWGTGDALLFAFNLSINQAFVRLSKQSCARNVAKWFFPRKVVWFASNGSGLAMSLQ